MASETANYQLIKPDPEEFYDISVPNGNMDKIDAALKVLSEALDGEELATLSQAITNMDKRVTAHTENNELHLQPGERKKWNDVSTVVSALKMIKSDKDTNGTFTNVKTYRKADNTLYQESILSGGTSPNYTTRTVKTYDVDGISVVQQDVYTLMYDEDGTLISEV